MNPYDLLFAIEVFEAATHTDSGSLSKRITKDELCELARLLLEQECGPLVPPDCRDGYSYIMAVQAGLDAKTIREIIVDAKSEVIPVLLDAGNGYVPNASSFLFNGVAWNELRGYGPIPDLFPEKLGYRPWFGVFSDSIGTWLLFWYPEDPKGIIEIPYDGLDIGGFKIFWKHGKPGLCYVLQVLYVEWMVRMKFTD